MYNQGWLTTLRADRSSALVLKEVRNAHGHIQIRNDIEKLQTPGSIISSVSSKKMPRNV